MSDDWKPIEKAGKYGGPIVLIDREPIIRRLQDGLIAARAKMAVIVHRPKICADTSHIEDELASAIAGQSFKWGDPVEERESDVELPATYWASDKLGHPWLDLWHSGDARLESADGNERVSFYGLQLLGMGSGKIGMEDGEALPQIAAGAEFDEARPDWVELWQGPLNFRATYDKGQFGPGHSLERINQYGREGATGGGRHAPIYSVRLDDDDGAIVIEWLIGLPGRAPPYQSIRYYPGGLGRGLYNRLKDDPKFRDQQMSHLPANQRARAVGAYACGISMREWAEREFFQAIHAGHCEIWARVGSQVAPFRLIPADVFRAYTIQEWGYGVPGGARATLDGAPTLYSIRVSPPSREACDVQPDSKAAVARKGRTKGTGFQRADKPLLARMAKAIEDNPALNATSAAKLVADEAEGASFEAKVDRLARAFRAGKNGG